MESEKHLLQIVKQLEVFFLMVALVYQQLDSQMIQTQVCIELQRII